MQRGRHPASHQRGAWWCLQIGPIVSIGVVTSLVPSLENPAISVVVPLYNKAPYILRCLESIRRQSFFDFEAIIVDDGSMDQGGTIAQGIGDPRFTVIRQEN